MAFCEAVLVLALVLVVAARGGRGDVAAQPLYERRRRSGATAGSRVSFLFFATAKLAARAIVIHQEHATGAWKGEEEENTGAGRWSNAYAKEHERLTTKVQQRLPFAESRCAHAAIQHK